MNIDACQMDGGDQYEDKSTNREPRLPSGGQA